MNKVQSAAISDLRKAKALIRKNINTIPEKYADGHVTAGHSFARDAIEYIDDCIWLIQNA